MDVNTGRLREARAKLGRLYNSDEVYCAQRSRVRWMREGGKTTKIFMFMRHTIRRRIS